MGLHDREYYRDDRSDEFSLEKSSVVVRIIAVTVAVFIFDLLFGQGRFLFQHDLLGCNRDTLLQPWKIWQLLTYGFAHADVWHLAHNMIALYFFGRELEYHVGKREFANFYIAALFVGSLSFCLGHVFSGQPVRAIGASGAVMAVLILFCLKFPFVPILRFPFEVPAWLAGTFYVLSDLAGLAGGVGAVQGNRVAHEIHLAGAAFAAVYWYGGWHFSSLWDATIFQKLQRWWRRRRGPALRVHRPDGASSNLEAEADRLLIQVKERGLDSLTAKERKILEEYSREVRNRLQ